MAASGNTNPGASEPPPSSTPVEMEEATARQANKRYEGLLTVRSKAVKGKGAWYWAHLEPLLIRSSDTGLPTAVKLKCCLCDAVFSASNPSRTASEHLTRGACPNFISSPAAPLPTLMIDSPSNQRKRTGGAGISPSSSTSLSYLDAFPLSMVEPTTTRHSQELLAAAFSPSSPSPSPVAASMAAVGSSGGGVTYPYHHLQQQQQQQQQLNVVLSGGKEDWGALAMFKDNVKRLKSPHSRYKPSPSSSSSGRRQGLILTKEQIDSALDCLADWVYDSCGSGSVPLSTLEHPKFKAFLTRVGLTPSISTIRDFIYGSRLDSKYEEAKADAEAKIRDAMLFQISTQGWSHNLVIFTVNLPNGTSVFRRALLIPGTATDHVPPEYAEEVLWETVQDVSSVVLTNANDDGNPNNVITSTSTSSAASPPPRCAGIVGDCRFRSKLALRNLEKQHPWMVNLSCQYQGISSLVNDLYRELPLFHDVADNCRKIAGFVNNNTQLRSCFLKYRIQEYGKSSLLRVAPPNPALLTSAQDDDDDDDEEEEDYTSSTSTSKSSSFTGGGGHDFEPVFSMLEDIAGSIRVLQLVLLDDSYTRIEDSEYSFREFRDLIRDSGFWNNLEAVRSLVKLIKETASDVETERPLVGQCLPIWEDLRAKVNKDWLGKFHISESTAVIVQRVISRRFEKNYHPAWAAAYILDPVNLIRDGTGKYLPPFKHLTPRQEKDVDRLVIRLASSSSSSSSEASHVVVLMELMKWRTEGLDPDYAQAVQLKQRDPVTGKMRIAIPQSSRLVWETYLTEFKALGKVAVRLIFLHATATSPRGFNNNLPPTSSLRSSWLQGNEGMDPAALEKIMFIAANSKLNLERRDIFAADQDKDAHLFATDHMSESGF